MIEEEQRRQRRRKLLLMLKELRETPFESPRFAELVAVLEDLKAEGVFIDVRICPSCKSPRVRPVTSLGDPLGHMGLTPRKYECLDCGWRGTLEMALTNRPLTEKQQRLVMDAHIFVKEEARKLP